MRNVWHVLTHANVDNTRQDVKRMMMKLPNRGHVNNSRAYPGADVNLDHNLVAAKIELIIIIIIIRLASCLVLSTLAWVRTCQTISHK